MFSVRQELDVSEITGKAVTAKLLKTVTPAPAEVPKTISVTTTTIPPEAITTISTLSATAPTLTGKATNSLLFTSTEIPASK